MSNPRQLLEEAERLAQNPTVKGKIAQAISELWPSPPPPTSTLVGLVAGGWGPTAIPDVAACVKTVRLDQAAEPDTTGWTKAGMHVIGLIAGPYLTGGVKAINASEWVAKAVAYVKANAGLYAFEVLNEPYGDWYWGPEASSDANKAAYARLVKLTREAFVANFGSARPLVLAHYSDPSWGPGVWDQAVNGGIDMSGCCDGAVVHPYPPEPGTGEARRNQVEEAHAKTGKPVFITEVGWETNVVSYAQQAAWIKSFVNWCKGTGYVAAVTAFNYRDFQPLPSENQWGVETHEGVHKPSYQALHEVS